MPEANDDVNFDDVPVPAAEPRANMRFRVPPDMAQVLYGGIRGAAPPPDIQEGPRAPIERSDIVGSILRKNKMAFINRPSDEWILPDTMIGIEVELEGVARNGRGYEGLLQNGTNQYWAAHEDGSLHDSGCEFTLKVPLFGEDLHRALRGMFDLINAQPWKATLRTGIHIHLDARDLTRHQLLGLLGYYTIFEPALYAWVGAGRHANNFCVPWYKYEGALDHSERILRLMRRFAEGENVDHEGVAHECQEFHRYAGLNLKSLAEFGSVEFRQLETTKNYEVVKDWINIIMSLKRAAMEVPESTAVIVHEVERRGIVASMQRIFGERVAKEMLDNNPACQQEIATICLPNALNMITMVTTPAEPPRQDRNWNIFLKDPEKPDHPGFKAWRKANYPKDLKPNPEAQAPPPDPNEPGLRGYEEAINRLARDMNWDQPQRAYDVGFAQDAPQQAAPAVYTYMRPNGLIVHSYAQLPVVPPIADTAPGIVELDNQFGDEWQWWSRRGTVTWGWFDHGIQRFYIGAEVHPFVGIEELDPEQLVD